MTLSKAKQDICNKYGLSIKEEQEEYVLIFKDAEIARGDEMDISNFLNQLSENEAHTKMGEAIQSLREQRGISLTDFAYMISASEKEVELLENGNLMPEDMKMNQISGIFGVSAQELKKGNVVKFPTQEEMMSVLQNIEQLLLDIKKDNAELKNFLKRWNLEEVYQSEKSLAHTPEVKEESMKTPDESMHRYTAVPQSQTHGGSGAKESPQDGYYVVVDTYTGEVVTNPEGYEETFTEEAVALAFAAMLEKQADRESQEETPALAMLGEKEQDLVEEAANDMPEQAVKMRR